MKINFKPSIAQIIFGVVALVLFVGAFIGVNYLVATWCLTSLTGEAVNGCGNVPTAGPTIMPGQTPGTAVAPSPTVEVGIPDAPLPAAWDGASRINILVMGVDTEAATDANGNPIPVSPDRAGPPKTDTLIVLTVDPQTKTAGMISIPRDLLVNIPGGFGYGRINMAYGDGEGAKLPGGGPALAMRTVEQVLGVPIQYYAQIDFWAFSQFIDDIGKINVYVRKKIIIDPVGPGEDKVMLSKDWHLLNGPRALAYVRNRHTENGDIDRSQRQQDVILAIRDKVLSPANLPLLVLGAPQVYKDLSAGIHTNLTFEQMMALGMLAKDIPVDQIKRGLIDNTMITFGNITLGGMPAAVLKPIPDKIRELRDTIFVTGGAVSPLAKGANALDLAKQEGASLIVLNGSGTQGLALQTGDYLKSLGLNVVNNGNASQNPAATKVIDHTGRPYMLKYLKELFGVSSSSQITSTYDPNAAADIEIILGSDWALKNSMPK